MNNVYFDKKLLIAIEKVNKNYEIRGTPYLQLYFVPTLQNEKFGVSIAI